MRFFLNSTSNASWQPGEGVKHNVTNCYIEFEYAVNDFYFVLYVIPRSNSSVFIATCWDRVFDDLLGSIENEDDLETMLDTWPKLAKLLMNGANDLYSEGALIKLEDFDTGEPKWFVASVSGNINIDNPEGLFNDRTEKITQLIIERSLELFAHLQENQPSILRAIGKGIAKGFGLVALAGLAGFFGVDLDGDN